MVAFVTSVVISGILFGAIPAMWLIPALHGRIEPLLGVRPRVPGEPIPGAAPKAGWFVAAAVLLAIASFFFAFLEAWDVSIGSVETDLRGQFGDGFLWVSVGAIVVAVGVAVLLFRSQRKKQGN